MQNVFKRGRSLTYVNILHSTDEKHELQWSSVTHPRTQTIVGSGASMSTRPVWLQNGLNTHGEQYFGIIILTSPNQDIPWGWERWTTGQICLALDDLFHCPGREKRQQTQKPTQAFHNKCLGRRSDRKFKKSSKKGGCWEIERPKKVLLRDEYST